jgi:hypothetical protein
VRDRHHRYFPKSRRQRPRCRLTETNGRLGRRGKGRPTVERNPKRTRRLTATLAATNEPVEPLKSSKPEPDLAKPRSCFAACRMGRFRVSTPMSHRVLQP